MRLTLVYVVSRGKLFWCCTTRKRRNVERLQINYLNNHPLDFFSCDLTPVQHGTSCTDLISCILYTFRFQYSSCSSITPPSAYQPLITREEQEMHGSRQVSNQQVKCRVQKQWQRDPRVRVAYCQLLSAQPTTTTIHNQITASLYEG